MPRLDKKGPEGQGPRTGRGLGRCNPDFDEKSLDENMDHANFAYRQRLGFGRNRRRSIGRGRGNRGWRSGMIEVV